MRKLANKRFAQGGFFAASVALGVALTMPQAALADEGGVSFWIPGFFGSLAAAPQQPGWSLTTIYYHTSVNAGGDVAFARQVNRGRITTNFTGNLSASLDANADLAVLIPAYVFARKVLGGQLSVGMIGLAGRNEASVDATLTGSLGPLGISISGGRSDAVTGFGDLLPLASLRWNRRRQQLYDLHHRRYSCRQLRPYAPSQSRPRSRRGRRRGFGYTYFNPQTGNEFSAVLGFTYNLENQKTDYKNGIDMHLDWGASKFLTKQIQVGLVGYVYDQISPDSGSGDRVGSFESRVIGVGPQVGFIFPVGDMQGYLNLKGYKEFDAAHRPDGWNAWLTFVISPEAPKATARSMVR